MEQIPGPDGFLFEAASSLAAGHHELNHYLLRVEEAGWQAALKEINGLRDKKRKLEAWRALPERVAWLCEHIPTSNSLSPLRGLGERIEKWKLALGEGDLVDLLERSAAAARVLAPYPVVVQLMVYVEANGLTPTLSEAIRSFRQRTGAAAIVVNQTSLQLFNSRLDMLAWRDEWDRVDLERCWSEQVRASYRAMHGAEREEWRRLLHSICGDEGVKPVASWLADTRERLEALGADGVRERLRAWFAPLGNGAPHKLSREGSFLLRSLIWVGVEVGGLKDEIAAIAEAQFKPKGNGQKVMRAASEALGTDNSAVPQVAPRQIGGFDIDLGAIAAKAIGSVFSSLTASTVSSGPLQVASSPMADRLAGRVTVDGDVIHIRGELDRYHVDISSGEVFRESDGAKLKLPPPVAVPALANNLPHMRGLASLMSSVLLLAEDRQNLDKIEVA